MGEFRKRKSLNSPQAVELTLEGLKGRSVELKRLRPQDVI